MTFFVVQKWFAVLIAHHPQVTNCKGIHTTAKLGDKEAMFLVIINFQKENSNTYMYTFNHSYIEKSSNRVK